MDPNFGIEVAYFSNEAVFEQRVRLKKPAATVNGVLEFMVCDDQRCLPPTEVEFSIKANHPEFKAGGAATPKATAPKATTPGATAPETATPNRSEERRGGNRWVNT